MPVRRPVHGLIAVVRSLRPSIGEDLRGGARRLVSRKRTRAALNQVYLRLPEPAHVDLYDRYAKMFRGVECDVESGVWRVPFRGRRIALPITPGRIWLDWDAALSLLGHEPEIKRTYRALLAHRPPDLFLDVGANYGGHSLLFAASGVPHVAFEPNPVCHDYAREAARLNGIEPRIVQAAVGAGAGTVTLSYPERETWLGTVDADLRAELAQRGPLQTVEVAMAALDDLVGRPDARHVLLKIDVEGGELGVVQGARRLLASHRPVVLFESTPQARDRDELAAAFRELGYRIASLPWDAASTPRWLEPTAFAEHQGANFLALAD
jgi:FkbM family methyltransferase